MKRLEIKPINTIKELKKELKTCKTKKEEKRVQTIIMKKQGFSTQQITKELKISRTSLSKWIKIYNFAGIKYLKMKPVFHRKWKNEYFAEIKEELKNISKDWTLKEIQQYIKNIHNVEIPISTIRHTLIKFNLKWKMEFPRLDELLKTYNKQGATFYVRFKNRFFKFIFKNGEFKIVEVPLS